MASVRDDDLEHGFASAVADVRGGAAAIGCETEEMSEMSEVEEPESEVPYCTTTDVSSDWEESALSASQASGHDDKRVNGDCHSEARDVGKRRFVWAPKTWLKRSEKRSTTDTMAAVNAPASKFSGGKAAPLQAHDALDEFARFQAIIAGLPHQLVPSRRTSASARAAAALTDARAVDLVSSPKVQAADVTSPRGAAKVRRKREPTGAMHRISLQQRAEAAIGRACLDYPSRASELGTLKVVHASLDLLALADHAPRRLFLAARGTDKDLRLATLPRDLGNDAMIFLGFGPARTGSLATVYEKLCDQFPGYSLFGTGHSLGASVVEWLASRAETQARRATKGKGTCTQRPHFTRIDLFNPGSSPLQRLRGARPLKLTEVHSHRVFGDLVSRFHAPSGARYVIPRQPHFNPHSLRNFMPEADDMAVAARETVAAVAERVARRVACAQVAARSAVEAVAARCIVAVLRAQKQVCLAEAAASADSLDRPVRRGFFGPVVARVSRGGGLLNFGRRSRLKESCDRHTSV
eukprot:TRINITY_DN29389_c0_g1_i1.p1 TRINITY_DN29389_c0_g1~~TRINITY_DN29389_c0_g1_i1.p1  ORF type:complete len:524 (-),score=74.29 TRINITY_DN29389_c0_g1_i1:172-1743(-)